ncbi:hypothetical protein [Aulosira sp. FACHB-615]|uniref:hypothetical protein n=1 Tax=Aulosira sp. FACHB-615 TaxID=2692777 RepID=UPI00168360EB|nr:hypothetical protein [Aulosira sp. FACHB-615]MBD2489020.1 hypothetical protein [Aulosira sp. FACHB-615]
MSNSTDEDWLQAAQRLYQLHYQDSLSRECYQIKLAEWETLHPEIKILIAHEVRRVSLISLSLLQPTP